MPKLSLLVLLVTALCGVFSLSHGAQKDWTYKLVQINWNTTNPDILKTPLRTVRVAPGVYGINGSIVVGVDAGDEYSVEARLTRSASGSSQYGLTPFSIPTTPLTKFMNTHYKNFFKADLKDCSDLPQFEDEWEGPLEKREYVLTSCVITTDNFPTHMQPGMYKVLIIVTGPSLVGVIEALAQIDPQYN